MKNIKLHTALPAIIGLTCAASCTSDNDMPDCTTPEVMTFDVAGATRATVITSLNKSNESFRLYGNLNTGTQKVNINGATYQGLINIFDAKQITYNSSKWDYGNTRYWLLGQLYSFVAIYPYSAPGVSDMTFEDSDSRLNFTYIIPSDLNTVPDLLVATDRRKIVMTTSGTLDSSLTTVSFAFNHLMSQIDIQVALDESLMYPDETDRETYPYNKDEYIGFQRVEIYGVKTTAKYTVEPSSTLSSNKTSTSIINREIIDDIAYTELTYTIPSDKTIHVTNNNTLTNIFPSPEHLLMLPQEVPSDSEAKMVFIYTVNDNTEREREIILPLKGTNWEPGKKYTYKFTVSKAYTGQIKAGSLEIVINDFTDEDADDRWISDEDLLKFEFDGPK